MISKIKVRITKTISKWLKKVILIGSHSRKGVWINADSKPKIIICFDGRISHGGLVDRLKGIISFYQIAKMLDYEFKIIFKHPFQLSYFLESNQVEWEAIEKDEKFYLFSSKILYLVNEFDKNPLKIIRKSKSKTFFVYSNVDYLPVLFPDKSRDALNEIWRNNYDELFKTSNYLKEQLRFLPITPYIVFHTRFTSLLGDFSDTVSLVLDDEERQILLRKVLKSIDVEALIHQGNEIYVLSDSISFLEAIKENTNYKVLKGAPTHIELGSNDLDSHAKTFIDFYFIINSEKVFLVMQDKMHNSNFSKYAAIIGNSNFKIITQ